MGTHMSARGSRLAMASPVSFLLWTLAMESNLSDQTSTIIPKSSAAFEQTQRRQNIKANEKGRSLVLREGCGSGRSHNISSAYRLLKLSGKLLQKSEEEVWVLDEHSPDEVDVGGGGGRVVLEGRSVLYNLS